LRYQKLLDDHRTTSLENEQWVLEEKKKVIEENKEIQALRKKLVYFQQQ